MATCVYKADFGLVHTPGPHPDRLGVDDLVVLPGDHEERDLYDPGLPGEPAAGDLTPPDTEGLGDGGRRRAPGIVNDLFCEVDGVGDEGAHPEPPDRARGSPQSV